MRNIYIILAGRTEGKYRLEGLAFDTRMTMVRETLKK
jgi:hypothetical protein